MSTPAGQRAGWQHQQEEQAPGSPALMKGTWRAGHGLKECDGARERNGGADRGVIPIKELFDDLFSQGCNHVVTKGKVVDGSASAPRRMTTRQQRRPRGRGSRSLPRWTPPASDQIVQGVLARQNQEALVSDRARHEGHRERQLDRRSRRPCRWAKARHTRAEAAAAPTDAALGTRLYSSPGKVIPVTTAGVSGVAKFQGRRGGFRGNTLHSGSGGPRVHR